VEAARKVGMIGLQFNSRENLETALIPLGVI
jgi:hypothetical protein